MEDEKPPPLIGKANWLRLAVLLLGVAVGFAGGWWARGLAIDDRARYADVRGTLVSIDDREACVDYIRGGGSVKPEGNALGLSNRNSDTTTCGYLALTEVPELAAGSRVHGRLLYAENKVAASNGVFVWVALDRTPD